MSDGVLFLYSATFAFCSLATAYKADIERDKGWVRGNPNPWLGLALLFCMAFLTALLIYAGEI